MKKLEEYIEQIQHPCDTTDTDLPDDECAGVPGAIHEYISDVIDMVLGDDGHYKIATPKQWLAYFRRLANNAGGMLEERRIVGAVRKEITAQLHEALEIYRSALRENDVVQKYDDMEMARLIQLATPWGLANLARRVARLRETATVRGLIRGID